MADTLMVDDEAKSGIAALLAIENQAWNEGNADGFAAWALPDIVFTNVMGMFSVGKGPFVLSTSAFSQASTVAAGSSRKSSISPS